MNLLIILLMISGFWCSSEVENTSAGSPEIIEVGNEQRIVFIAGFDEGDNRYYDQARNYFQSAGYPIVDSLYSLAEIVDWLNDRKDTAAFAEIHIVSHSNPWRGMSLKISPLGARITEDAIRSAQADGELPTLKKGISGRTKVIFHACGLGNNIELIEQLKFALTAKAPPQVFASPWYSIFSEGAAGHYLSRVYYVQYPTAHSPGPAALAQELAGKYPDVDINWREAMKTHAPVFPGQISYYRFNIPVEWTFDFADPSDMPQLKNAEEIMDWVVEQDEITRVLYTFKIPLEKFRWRTKTDGLQLTILAKTTVVCILQPIMQPEDPTEFSYPDIHDPALFAKR
ncbi:MAG: hypothetical protein R2824_06605 [Saprospiraceae bacterium]|nr:hypothetical protein [Lewinella sp.]